MKSKNEGQTLQNSQETKVSTLKDVRTSCSGSAIAPVYKRVFDKELNRDVVVKVDETNLFEFIQASKSMTDMAMLQKRFQETGEIPCADETLKFGVDTSGLPSDIHGVYNMVNDIDANFNKLPQSVKDVFGNSQAYLSAILNGTYQATLIKAFQEEKKEAVEAEKEGE